jgi:hypothetical protein
MSDYSDEDLVDFLQSLDGSDVEVTDWEARFIASNLDATWFTDRQRESIRAMVEKYGRRIGWL